MAEGARRARIVADPVRMGALETLLRQLGRRGVDGGLDVQERDGGLYFRDRFALLVAERRS